MQPKFLAFLISVVIVGCQVSSSRDTSHKPDAESVSVTPVERSLYRDGKALFLKRCAVCHGEKADGRGSLAETMRPPKPADFRNKRYSTMPVDSIRRVIERGGAATGRNPRMPPWEKELTTEQIDAAIAFIRSVGRFEQIPTETQVENSAWFIE